MSIKKKLMLIGVCIVIIIVVFTVNVIRRVKNDKPDNSDGVVVRENMITRAEAYRFLSYLEYTKTERELLPVGILYAQDDMSGWYDTYVNAVWKMGLIESNVAVSPMEGLTYGACKNLIDQLIIKKPYLQVVYSNLTFNFLKAEEVMPITDFLELYEAILQATPEEEKAVREQTLLILDREVTEDGKDRIVTDLGKYYYQNASSYEKYFEELKSRKQPEAEEDGEAAITPKADKSKMSDTTKKDGQEDKGTGSDTEKDSGDTTDRSSEKQADSTASDIPVSNIWNENMIAQYMDKGIRALVCDQELICVTALYDESITIRNAWIIKGEGLQVNAFISGIYKDFQSKNKLSSNIEKVIGDITVKDQKIIQISVKPDMIQGKVLQSGKDFIELEGYGKLPLEESYKIYKLYGELSVEPTGSILVGYDNTSFIVSGGKISAALITESIKAENIRVLISTAGFKGYYHEIVQFTVDSDFTISNKDGEKAYKAGDIVTVIPKDELLAGGRITVKPASDNAKIELLSLQRSTGNPKYRGIMEIDQEAQGLLLVNELPLEEYLYSVIPSEMPTYYGQEALKVQAVCARSYAYRQLMANSLSEYGAHVDDSAAFQVYNNMPENEESILAVKDTYGEVIEYDGEVITAYYYSTSSGHTTEPGKVWSSEAEIPYIKGKVLVVETEGEGSESQNDKALYYEDLSSEERFRSFIEDKELITYDSSFHWYRWRVTLSAKELKTVIDKNLAARYKANPNQILTMTKAAKNGQEAVFESMPLTTLGDIEAVTVKTRDSDGFVSELLIQGSEKTILVKKEYNIRCLLSPVLSTVIRQDESEIDNLSLLPSAFFYIEPKTKNGTLSSITIKGGGYGHGVGMSQNAVKALADAGKKYKDIVYYFYEGTDIGFIYD